MTDIVQEVQKVANKVYKNGLTYAQNIQNGVFIPAKALKNRLFHTLSLRLLKKDEHLLMLR